MYLEYSKTVSTPVLAPLRQARRNGSVGPLAMLAEAVRLVSLWHRRARERADLHQLCQLDERTLRDIGLGRDDVLREMHKPFWK